MEETDAENQSGLPAYPGGQSVLSQHDFNLKDSKGREWLLLKVNSRAKGVKQLPLFHNGDRVTGSVDLDFDKTSGVQAVSIAVTAGVTAVGQDEARFLYVPNTLWDSKAVAKTSGRHSWPFTLALPSEISIPSKSNQANRTYKLPPSFSERASPAYIEYKVIVTVRRGLFKTNQTLVTALVYLPYWRAESPSLLRRTAYQNGTPLLGPEADPDGWKPLPTVTITGTLFNSREIELQCTLLIAQPLSFARGSPIPLFLTITSEDEQALDLLAAPGAMKLYLLRSRVLGADATEETVSRSDHVLRERVGIASFWSSSDSGSAPPKGYRKMQGELHINSALKSSFVFPGFSLRYNLAMFPPQAPGFSCKAASDEPLLTEAVNIASSEAVGIAARSYAPPGYEEPEEADFNNTVGYLENGNQRFLHHGGHGGI